MAQIYEVTLSADAIVSATIEVYADSPSEAKAVALKSDENSLSWSVDSLHDAMENCSTYVRLHGEDVTPEEQ